ncbi:Dihydrofolate reductase [Friedmanniella luteola]|uniref:Dihydrofolate reductase n=1 Tax=Friedmanniella luteola TaxID=546871 RepID=A0A1H1SM71_9ACTN|nr:dihydrofolate reductase family protein [Friedmanniella luteola]SDS48816.1 Dihydrofolate reductase [Friedmanniella luteola]
MRRVVVYALMSLDGVAEEPGDWVFEVDERVFRNLAEVVGRQDLVLLGRATYASWVDYWPTSDVQPFADFVNGTPKHVVTSSPLDGAWPGAVAVGAPLVEHVRALRAGDGGDVGVHGSLTVARTLLAAGLVDELQLVVAPTVAGRGRRLFEGQDLQRLQLTRAEPTPSGCVLLTYRPSSSA